MEFLILHFKVFTKWSKTQTDSNLKKNIYQLPGVIYYISLFRFRQNLLLEKFCLLLFLVGNLTRIAKKYLVMGFRFIVFCSNGTSLYFLHAFLVRNLKHRNFAVHLQSIYELLLFESSNLNAFPA